MTRPAGRHRPIGETPGSVTDSTVEVVLPVHNEERALPGAVAVLHAHLTERFPFDWVITIADNGSTDGTRQIAAELARTLPRVRLLHVPMAGKGHALRAAWSASTADVVAYSDVDLSTGLDALLPMVASLVNGHCDIAVGSRLAPGARTVRKLRRDLLSRGFNRIVRLMHGSQLTDVTCGLKAARTAVIRPLLPHLQDESWFFDAELLLLAEHNGLRIHEVPVDWVEDVDSQVHVMSTVTGDLVGLLRMARTKVSGAGRVGGLPRRPDPVATHPDAVLAPPKGRFLHELTSFGVIGVLSTLGTLALYAVLRVWWPPLTANLVAIVLVAVANTEANRRVTFRRTLVPSGRAHLQGLLVSCLYYAMTSGSLLLLDATVDRPSRPLELTVLAAASVLGTVARLALLRRWVFRPAAPVPPEVTDGPALEEILPLRR